MRIEEYEVYTTEEAQKALKVSSSTMMRLIKNGILKAGRVGRQYRIMGKEILHLISPSLEEKVATVYRKGKEWVKKDLEQV